MILERGTQILYVPTHAEGDADHPDCEAGFVTSVGNKFAFCRYWSKHTGGKLRTKLNSEATQFEDIVVMDTVPQKLVEEMLEKYC